MPLTLTECPDSRQTTTGENGTVTLKYILEGTADDLAAKTLVANSVPETYDGLVRQSIEIEPLAVDESAGDGKWLASIRYGVRPAPAETGESTFQFDTGGASQHITQALKHITHTACPSQTAEDFLGAIGVSGSGDSRTVEGVDIIVPVYAWSETHYISDTDVQARKAAYYALTGKTNNATWKGFAAGEVLFLGASGSKRGADDWEITFKFAASPNVTDVCADWPGGSKPAAAVAKKGWEVFSVYYRQAEGAKDLIPKPVQIDINQVYRDGDFAGLYL
jgi:hypothetical protein